MFPNHFPSQAIDAALKYALGTDRDNGRLALTLYELTGYGLYQVFGDVKYLMSGDPMFTQDQSESILISAGFTTSIRDRIRERFNELKNGNLSLILIIVQLLMEYGPMIRKLIDDLRKLFNETPTT
jgi:hypothetical protein